MVVEVDRSGSLREVEVESRDCSEGLNWIVMDRSSLVRWDVNGMIVVELVKIWKIVESCRRMKIWLCPFALEPIEVIDRNRQLRVVGRTLETSDRIMVLNPT